MIFCDHGKIEGGYCKECPNGRALGTWTPNTRTAETMGLPLAPSEDKTANAMVVMAYLGAAASGFAAGYVTCLIF